MTVATAFVGIALLAATLIIGPLNALANRPNPVSTTLRRDIGIWAAIAGTAHTVVGLQVHMQGNLIRYFLPDPARGARISAAVIAFLSANYTGLAATLLLLLLLAISNDVSLRALGSRRWKRIQRLNYLVFGLIAIHGVLYALMVKAGWVVTGAFLLISIATVAIQLAGRRARKSAQDDEVLDPPAGEA